MTREQDLLKYYDVPGGEGIEAVPATYTPIPPEERKRRVSELNKKVAENIERLQNSTEFHNYLIAMSRFHNYSWGNQMAIWVQKPDATRVAGYNTWRDLGRWVKAGEAGIGILAPLGPTGATTWFRATDQATYAIKRGKKGWDIYDNHENLIEEGFPSYAAAGRRLKEMGFVAHKETLSVNNFKVVHVFDLSQTDGKPLPRMEVPPLTGEANQWLFDALLKLASSRDVYVRFESKPGQTPSIKGSYEAPNLIWIRPEEAPAMQLNALNHELAHYFTEAVFRIPRADAETIAECAACVVGAYHGFDTGVRSFPYVAVWAKDPKVLHANMDTIQKVADRIITDLEPTQPELLPMTDGGTRMTGKSESMTLTALLTKYSKRELESMARNAEINPSGRSKWWLLSTLVRKGIIKI